MKRPRPLKADFSDSGKRRKGVVVFDAVEARRKIEELQRALAGVAEYHDKAIALFRTRVRAAIAMLEEGRKGDAMRELRAIVVNESAKIKLPDRGPDSPSAA